ncbi:MAG: nucleoside-diphosphate kinase [Chloroflexi bacterium]|nr:nucleoside-diphosphate kinase [Chloroflexota bacterium]
MERTLVLLKPDAIQRNLSGEIIKRLESRGLKIIALKFLLVDEKTAQDHYKEHINKPFYEGLIRYITSAPLLAMVWEGPQAIAAVRQTMGSTNPLEATPGSIRHDFALLTSRNLTHASDSAENAEKEISIWFKKSEIFSWERIHENWFSGKN